jgi:hypothetical protein
MFRGKQKLETKLNFRKKNEIFSAAFRNDCFGEDNNICFYYTTHLVRQLVCSALENMISTKQKFFFPCNVTQLSDF